MPNLDPKYIRDSLRRLVSSGIDLFGMDEHRFEQNKPLAEAQVDTFEKRHGVRLPADYRDFVTQIANGGAGPSYGLFPLGYMDDVGTSLKSWTEGDGFVGILSRPFQFDESWNDLSGMPDFDPVEGEEEEHDEQMAAFEEKYWSSSLMDGAFPICHRGCGLRL